MVVRNFPARHALAQSRSVLAGRSKMREARWEPIPCAKSSAACRRFSSDAYGGRTRSANSPDKVPEVSALLFFIILSDRKMQAKRNPSRALLRETGSNCLFARLLQGSLPEGLWMRSERASRRPWSTTGRKPGSAARILMGGLRTARSEPRYKPFRRRSGRWR